MGAGITTDQIFLFGLFGLLFAMLVWGRVRYDLVAFAALLVAVFAGHVAPDAAFAGFGHPAVVIIALVLIVSRGLVNSGAVELIARFVVAPDRALPVHISVMAVAGAALSAVINNVAALALLITLIGTPPNIVIAQYRQDALGAPFSMFDFTPVGLIVSVVGIAFVALVGWRLIPARDGTPSLDGDAGLYVAEARVREGSRAIGQMVRDLYPDATDKDVQIIGLVRRGKRLPGFARTEAIRKGDFLVLEGDPKSIEAFMGTADLDFAGSEKHGGLRGANLALIEAIVPDTARIVNRSAMDVRLLYRHGVTLLGVSRGGKRFRDRVRKLTIRPGDVLLLLGPDDRMDQVAHWLGVYPLADRKTALIQRRKALAAIAAFGIAIALAVTGVTTLAIGLGACVVAYIAMGLLGGEDFYAMIEWKVIVLLASLIPLSAALEASGGTELIANAIVGGTEGWPAWAILLVLMVVTMTMSDFLNNVATALIAAPIGVSVAQSLGASPDPFLMGVAVAASCAFLTPIGHKNNTIIMGPGGYQFGDYWRMGLALEVIVIAVAVPAILWVWPL